MLRLHIGAQISIKNEAEGKERGEKEKKWREVKGKEWRGR